MLVAERQMRFGKAAISIGKRRMGISVTEISAGEAPTAVTVTAMRIAARKKRKDPSPALPCAGAQEREPPPWLLGGGS
jgi:hypothetical protein